MSKGVIKELIIILLIILAIILILGVLLYEYVPNNKIIPEEVSYTTSKKVKEEIQDASGPNEVVLTKTLDQSDLDNYQITNDYRPGKPNPFSTYKKQDVENSDSNSENSSSGSSSSESGSSGSSSSGSSSSGNNVDSQKPILPGNVNPGNYTNNNGLK